MADSNVKNENEKETSGNETYSPTDSESALIEKWKKRFTRAENYLRPYRGKWLRMYKLYRAYQEKVNYAYQTRLMPPIAFQIVETVASRLVTAKRKTRVLPREKEDVNSKSIQAWDDLVGGHIDDGESFREAVVREVKEETGIDISIEDVSVAHVMQHVHVAYVSIFLTAKQWSGDGVIMESEKCDDLGWFPIDSLPEDILPYIATGLRNIQKDVFYSEETDLTEKSSSRSTNG
jgi:8-oxo-dGTP diphosphatase